MQAEVPQPISAVPLRWGGFTSRQLAWVGAGALLPYLLLRAHLAMELALALAAPWLAASLLFAFGRREGRPLDAWVGDWVWFAFQPHRLQHPGAAPRRTHAGTFVSVDDPGPVPSGAHSPEFGLPWVAPWP
ncbi:MAG: PrgI family mobile element protein [Candidatus Dormibacteria bacterium]